MSPSAIAITDATVCAMPLLRFNDMRDRYPAFSERFNWLLELENHLLVEALSITAMGSAIERVARILCELAIRLSNRETIESGDRLKTPLTQRLIAEATGLTAIHVNRVIRRLRELRLVDLEEGVLIILNPKRSMEMAQMGSDLAALGYNGAHDAIQVTSGSTPLPRSNSANAPRSAKISAFG